MSHQIQIIGEDRIVARVHEEGRALVTVPSLHARLHDGRAYQSGIYDAALADTSVINMLVRVGANREVHGYFVIIVEGKAVIELFEGATVSADGVSVPIVNRNRNSTNTMETLVFNGPTITDDGTPLGKSFIPAGTKNQSVGGEASAQGEWVLKNSTDYLVRLTNNSGAAMQVSMILDLYDHGENGI